MGRDQGSVGRERSLASQPQHFHKYFAPAMGMLRSHDLPLDIGMPALRASSRRARWNGILKDV